MAKRAAPKPRYRVNDLVTTATAFPGFPVGTCGWVVEVLAGPYSFRYRVEVAGQTPEFSRIWLEMDEAALAPATLAEVLGLG